jgi:hypothetical protein
MAKACELMKIKIFGLVITVFGLFSLVTGLILAHVIHSPQIPRIDRQPNDNISFASPPVSMCKGGTEEWDLIQLAGMSLVPEFMRNLLVYTPNDQAQVRVLLDTLGIWHSWMELNLFDRYLRPPNFLAPTPETNKPWRFAIVFPGTGDRFDLAFMLENVVPLVASTVLSAMIPFYRITRAYFFSTVETHLEQTLQLAIAGPRRLSLDYWVVATAMTRTIFNMFQSDHWFGQYVLNWTNQSSMEMTAYIGHGSYGMLAKGMTGQALRPGFAFQSPQFSGSPVSVFQE